MTEMIGRHLENEKCIWVDSSQLAVACEITFQAEGEFCRYRAGPHPLFVAVCVGYFCKTTIPFHRQLMDEPDYVIGNYTTKFMESFKMKDPN